MNKQSIIGLIVFLGILVSCGRKQHRNLPMSLNEDENWFEREQAEDLSGNNWRVWLDSAAQWQNDSIFVRTPAITGLPVNVPSCGWEKLERGIGKNIKLPATIEEHFWGQNGNSFGVSGDYMGVSWFSTQFNVSRENMKRRIVLHFESARLRAEIFINRKLAGYNLVDGVPFEVDASKYVKAGKNSLAVRITDPNGDFTWCDWPHFSWGNFLTVPSHAFGGITGRVNLYVTSNSHIEDVFVKNKPGITEIDAEVSLAGHDSIDGNVTFSLSKWDSDEILTVQKVEIKADSFVSNVKKTIIFPNAELWSPNSPSLYKLVVRWKGADGSSDEFSRRFGFRWFEIRDQNGDKQFFLNNKRIVLRTAISWGFWPVNGIYPTRELAIKQINTAKKLGLNMLNFHRCIGHPLLLDLADELGILYYEEPGGYREGDDVFSQLWGREKLLRMIKRDRSHPSLIIYNMANETTRDPKPQTKIDIADAHKLDETRIITYTSQYFSPEMKQYAEKCPQTPALTKMHMLPYNHELLFQGWWDEHHAAGPGSYFDEMYNSPSNYYLNTSHKSEIIFYGEEGAIGTPPRLELIKNTIEQQDQKGWDGHDYLRLFDVYDKFISERGFRKAFPNVDNLTRSMGNVAFYYQGRAIENMRINNTNDGYAINGWEEIKFENHSGIVDCYRNPKGDAAIISYYNQPLYLAVKARNKVIETNFKTLIDVFIVNEADLNGAFNLELSASDKNGEIFKQVFPVKVTGGNTYGEMLVKEIALSPVTEGYCEISARLTRNNEQFALGKEQLYVVNAKPFEIDSVFSVMDSSGIFSKYFEAINYKNLPVYKDGRPKTSVLLVGAANPPQNYPIRHALFEWVAEGHTLVIAGNAKKWAEELGRREIIDYRGAKPLGTLWYGGNYFVKENSLFEGLPVNCVFNWEYQCFAQYKRQRIGLRLVGDDVIVGATSDHKQELYSAVSVIPLGRGKIILSTLDILGAIQENKQSSVVAKKVLLNYLKVASKKSKK